MFNSHFSVKTIKALARKGVSIIGIQALPGADGSYANCETGYVLDDNGTNRIRMYREVLALAN